MYMDSVYDIYGIIGDGIENLKLIVYYFEIPNKAVASILRLLPSISDRQPQVCLWLTTLM